MIVPMQRSAGASEENVLPLINIVFLLLIFFMIAGTLSATSPFEIAPPSAASPDSTRAPRGGVAIAVDGRVAFGGEPIAPASLPERARGWQELHAGGPPLAVRADAGAPSQLLLETIDALRQAGVERIRLLAVSRHREQ